jgi:heat shock protein HtpX
LILEQKEKVTYWGRLARRLGAQVFEQALREKDRVTKSGMGPALLSAQSFSLLILATPVLVGVLGVAIIIFDFPNLLTLLVGGTLIALGWCLWPRRHKNDQKTYYRADLPEMFALLDQISAKLGGPKIDGVHVFADYNAYFTEYRRPDERILGIGMLLWETLTPQERVAVIAHELGHSVNEDPARTDILSKALNTLGQWRSVLYYDQLDTGFMVIFLSFLYGSLNLILDAIEGVLTKLLFWESQTAEYRADRSAIEIAGPSACITLLEKITLGGLMEKQALEMHITDQTNGGELLTRMSGAIVNADPEERSKLIHESLQEDHTIDATHPPTKFRIKYANSFKALIPSVSVPKSVFDKIDDELGSARELAGESLLSEMLLQ